MRTERRVAFLGVDCLDLEHVRAAPAASLFQPREHLPGGDRHARDGSDASRARRRCRTGSGPGSCWRSRSPSASGPGAPFTVDAPPNHCRHDGLVRPLSRHVDGRLVPGLDDQVEAPVQCLPDGTTVALEAERVDRRTRCVPIRRQRAATCSGLTYSPSTSSAKWTWPQPDAMCPRSVPYATAECPPDGGDDVPVREDLAIVAADRDRFGPLRLPGRSDRTRSRRPEFRPAAEMSTPKWNAFDSACPSAPSPIRGSPKKPRTGCCWSNGRIGQP